MTEDAWNQPPERAFWLDELRFPDFDELLTLRDDEDELRERAERAYSGPAPRRLFERILDEHGDGPEVLLNLLMVAGFLGQKKSSAVCDVALARLPVEVVQENRNAAGRIHRLPLAARLFGAAPVYLLEIDVLHRWHSRRRWALELAGPNRKPPEPLREIDWAPLGRAGLGDLRRDNPRVRRGLEYRATLFRGDPDEVLLAFREPARRSTVRTAGGRVVSGRDDEWTLLRFHRGGLRVDVTAPRPEVGADLASAVASRLWERDLEYRPARDPLSSDALNELLARLVDPDDDIFRLLEITAEVPGHFGRPMITASNSGQARVEAAVAHLRGNMAFADDWRTVQRVKVGFDERYRIVVHFPAPGEELVLSYADTDRDKEESRKFEELVQQELGVEIHPKEAHRRMTRRRRKRAKPKGRLSSHVWSRLLRPILDEPEIWELEAIRSLARDGLVSTTDHTVFRCGDPALNRRAVRADTLDCPGEVEMPFGEADPNDPFRQEDDAEFACGHCGHAWYPGRYRLPVRHRVRISVELDAVWQWLLALAGKLGTFDVEAPGIASGFPRGTRAYLLFLPLIRDPRWLDPRSTAVHAVCALSTPGDERLAQFGAQGTDLSAILEGSKRVLERAWDLGKSTTVSPSGFLIGDGVAESPRRTLPRDDVTSGHLTERRVIAVSEAGVWLERQKICRPYSIGGRPQGVQLLLTLLWRAARKDGYDPTQRKLRSAEQLARLADDPSLDRNKVQSWVSRLRHAIRKNLRDEPGLAERIVEGGKGDGYRLGPDFDCHGLDRLDESGI